MATLLDQLTVAVEHHQAGRLQAAEEIYRRVLASDPDQPQVLHLLGVIAQQVGQHERAVEYIEHAIRLDGSKAVFHSYLGEAYRVLRKFPEAIRCFQRALQLEPGSAETHANLALAYKQDGQLADAVACYRKALRRKPDYVEAHNNLGNALQNQGALAEAILCYQKALALKPDFAEAYNNLGNAFHKLGQDAEAIACYQRTLHLRPDFADAYLNLCQVLRDQGQLDQATICAQRALQLKPDWADAHVKWGHVLKDQGRLGEAISSFRRALELEPDSELAHSNLVFALNFSSDYELGELLAEYRRWNQLHAQPLATYVQPHANVGSPSRRLRIGYVSADFTYHPVGRFILPLLQEHDHAAFEVFCYSSARMPDQITAQCRAHADVWRDVTDLSDKQLDQAVRSDAIDILVDLSMHTAGNRLLVFARKPAPVQVTYLAYCGTSGLDTMDYRFTDPHLDPRPMGPVGPISPTRQAGGGYSEESVWLPETYWCYRPPVETPAVSRLPALDGGPITFGSLNNFCKVTEPTLAAWSRLLGAMPEARLILHTHAGSHRDRVRDFFAQRGVAAERLTFLGRVTIPDYFKIYERIDAALDPFPCGGGTTTCDALWMGVPVVSLAGRTPVGRAGLSILANIGMADLVAGDVDNYVRCAVELARDRARLSDLRANLRTKMQSSALMDARRFARAVETAYREMWRRWCAAPAPR